MRGEKVTYLIAPNRQRQSSGGVFSTRTLPGGRGVRVLDRRVHDKALDAAKAALREWKNERR